MRHRGRWVLVAAALLLGACQTASATPSAAPGGAIASAPAPVELRVGDPAPEFALQDQNGTSVSLSQFRGRPVQLAFYIYALSGT